MGPSPMIATVSPARGRRLFQAAQHAGQRLDQRGILIAHCVGNLVRVALDDARRDADILRVGAVVEQQVLAEILQTALAEITFLAGRGIRRHHALADTEIL